MRGRELHRYAYDLLMGFRQKYPDLTFWVRQRGEDRLKQGFLFQGNDLYAFVGLYNRGGGSNMTRSVGIVFYPMPNGSVGIKLENAFNEEQDNSVLAFYEEMRNLVGGFRKMSDSNYQKVLNNPIVDLEAFIKDQKPRIDAILKKKGLEKLIITEEYFSNSLEKIYPYLTFNNDLKTENNKTKDMALNTILYGPPGTGKTYTTINMALEMLGYDISGKSRAEIKKEYDTRIESGEIVFTTFHQSLNYEDFIEGIKPVKPNIDDPFLKYEIAPGIFKIIAERALSNYKSSLMKNLHNLTFEDAFEKLQEEWEEDHEIKFPLKTKGYEYTITGFTKYSIQFKKASGGSSHTLSINTLRNLYYGQEYNFNQGVGIYYPGLLEKLKSYHGTTEKNVRKNYVIIIDEINRGNVSQIFGELITLIEKDKRLGNPEEISVKLAYSKEDFCVPPNLYILGTMNTADRSVEALDTALRRRFEFKEMMPDPEIIQAVFEKEYLSLCAERDDLLWEDKEWIALEQPYLDVITRNSDNTQFEKFKNEINKKKKPRDFNEYKYSWDNAEVKLITVKVLETINKRIEILLNRDHQIGHSYFIGKYTRKDIYQTFYQNIIPLLQEYFYGDYGKIGLVLGPDFVEIIKDEGTSLLADFEYSDAGDFDQKIIYRINAFPGNRDTPDYDIFYKAFCAIA